VDNFNERLSQFARENGADPKPALAALDNGQLGALVERDFQDGVARGVSKTPTVFVNGKAFVESFSVEELSQAIDDALAGN
jgi:protein-disulfide isomerase